MESMDLNSEEAHLFQDFKNLQQSSSCFEAIQGTGGEFGNKCSAMLWWQRSSHWLLCKNK